MSDFKLQINGSSSFDDERGCDLLNTPRRGHLPVSYRASEDVPLDGSHFYDWIDYNGVAFSSNFSEVTRMGHTLSGFLGQENSGK